MCFTNPICIFFYFFGVTMSSRTGRYAVIDCKLKQNANEGCNSCASLAGLVLCFTACFILLVITPLGNRKSDNKNPKENNNNNNVRGHWGPVSASKKFCSKKEICNKTARFSKAIKTTTKHSSFTDCHPTILCALQTVKKYIIKQEIL